MKSNNSYLEILKQFMLIHTNKFLFLFIYMYFKYRKKLIWWANLEKGTVLTSKRKKNEQNKKILMASNLRKKSLLKSILRNMDSTDKQTWKRDYTDEQGYKKELQLRPNLEIWYLPTRKHRKIFLLSSNLKKTVTIITQT